MSNAAAERELRMAAVMCHIDKSKTKFKTYDLSNVIQIMY